ncbi:MAG TPA: homocysteine methyltransferase [Clostridiales bacterium]|nr:homocysteine methyltransferase [Clostridiales bacterium]
MITNSIIEYLKDNVVCFDGAMGTEIIKKGLKLGEVPELYNVENREIIKDIHKSYVMAGCDVITANTFGANRLKLKDISYSVEEIIKSGIEIAKEASDGRFIALDVGPLGQMLSPLGTLEFDEAYSIFKEQVIAGEKYGADLILIETMSDLQELRIALLAAKENTELPVFCTMSFESNGRTFMGCSIEAMAMTLENMADAIGINCSLGPKEMAQIVNKLTELTNAYIIVQPNAGLPRIVDDKSIYDIDAENFSEYALEFVKSGVNIIGGCCGTTPEHIKNVVQKVKDLKPKAKYAVDKFCACSPSRVVEINQVRVIGERINPTGKKAFKDALLNNDIDYILRQGIMQMDAGADMLDVNVGIPDIDDATVMENVIQRLQAITEAPLQIDSVNPNVIERALRVYCGKAIVNSVNGEKKSLDRILPLVKKYGANVVALTLDENGIPKTAEERYNIAKKILDRALEYGICKNNIFIDCLTLTVSAQQEDAIETLKAIKMIKENLGLKTVLGVSNISFGLPNRSIINEVFLSQALAYGLDLPIINPNNENMMNIIMGHNVLHNIDKNSKRYIEKFSDVLITSDSSHKLDKKTLDLSQIIISGTKNEARSATIKLLQSNEALEIVDSIIIPSLDRVGEMYEKEKIFLPQLIQAAETVKEAFEVIKENLTSSADVNKGTILLATVKGDIHDIGKNIVKVVLENYGYKIIDLGRDISAERIVDEAKKNNIKLIGLSSLMTTTVKSMEETIRLLRKEYSACKVLVGGAVLTNEYSAKIGADFYAKDAKEAVDIAKKFFI